MGPGFAGVKNTYLEVDDHGGKISAGPRAQLGTWTVAAPPTNVSIAPNAGSGASQIFTATHGDSSGYQDINSAYLIINSGFAAVSACYVQWTAAGFSLLNDAASGWLGPIAAGSAATVQNSQCVLNAATSSASGSGNNRVVSYGITFLSGFAGTKNLYPFAIGAAGSSPYQSLGTWTVGAAETISTPTPPSGGTAPAINVSSAYTSGVAASSFGHALEYHFDWGDGTQSVWSGAASGSHAWTTTGARTVTVMARCAAHTAVVSSMSQPLTVNVVQTSSNTITTVPPGLQVTVDGATYTSPVTLQWTAGSTHTLTAAVQGATGIRYMSPNWNQSGQASTAVTAGVTSTIQTAAFTTQYYLTTAAGAGGTIVPASGWYDNGAVAALGITTSAAYVFSGFSGSLTGATVPQSLTMSAPAGVSANFLPDFTISTATGMATVMAGATTSLVVNISAPVSFTGTVAFDVPGLQNGFATTFSSASVPVSGGSGQTTMYITAPTGSAGNYVIYARGTSGTLLPHLTGINLVVQDYSVTVATDGTAIPPSGASDYQLTLVPLNGYIGTLSVSSIDMAPASCLSGLGLLPVSGNVYTLHVTTSFCSTFANPSATYTLTIRTGSGGISHNVTTYLRVTSVGSFSLSGTPLSQTVTPPATASFGINISTVNGNSTNVTFTHSGVPSCATLLTVPAPVSGSGGSTSLSVSTGGCGAGMYPISVTGTSGGFTNTLYLTLVIQGPAAPAAITSPATNTVLTSDTPVFTWTSGSQVSSYQLDLASTDGATVCSLRYSGQSTQAGMNLGTCCRVPRIVTAVLKSSFASGGSQLQSNSYSCGPPTSSPSGVSVSPSSGTASAQSFTATYYDVNGGADISQAILYIQASPASGPANQCIVRYDPGANSLFLRADDGNTYLGPIVGGSYDTLANSQCAITGGYNVQVSASALVVDISVVFASSFAGMKQVFLSALDSAGVSTGLAPVGTWTIPAGTSSGNGTPTPATPSDTVLPTPTPTSPGPVTSSVQACSDASGTWSDPNLAASNAAPGTWMLSRAGNTITGTLSIVSTACGPVSIQYSVSGAANGGLVHLDATTPNPAYITCGNNIIGEPTRVSVDVAITCPLGAPGNYTFINATPPRSPDNTMNPPAVVTTWTRRTFPPELGVTFGLAASKATVTVKGPRTGDLTISLLPLGATSQWMIGQAQSVSPVSDGQTTYDFPFDRTALPAPADFGRVEGRWGSSSDPNALAVSFPVSFSTIGYTHFTRYNTTLESKCLGAGRPATAYVFTGADCHVDTYQLNSLFIQQTSINGTGRADSVPALAGLLLHTFGEKPSPTL